MSSIIDTPKTTIVTSYRLKLSQFQNKYDTKDNYNRLYHLRTSSLNNESFNKNKSVINVNERSQQHSCCRYSSKDEKDDIINNGGDDDDYGEIDDEVFDEDFDQINKESNREYNEKLKYQQYSNISKQWR